MASSSDVKNKDPEQEVGFDDVDDLLGAPDDDHDDQFVHDEISSSISAQIFDFCDNELFPPETLTTSEAASCSNCCYEENSSCSASLSVSLDIKCSCGYDNTNAPPTATAATVVMATAATTDNNCSNVSMSFDPQEDIDNDISASINFSPCAPFSVPTYLAATAPEDQFDISQIQRQLVPSDPAISGGLSQYSSQVIGPFMASHPLTPVFEEDCLSSVPSFLRVNPSSSVTPPCNLLDLSLGPYLLDDLSPTFSAANSFAGSNIFMGSEMPQPQTMGYQEDSNAYFCPDSIQRSFHSGEIQSLCSDGTRQWMRSGAGNTNPSMTSEITIIEEPSYKVGKLSVEQRKEKIHRYMKKRNERNFTKKIKYACRKTLADSRPRVRGRFAKNDEYGSEHSNRGDYNHHEEDEDDEMNIKDEDELLNSSDIFSHISGVNAFNYNFPVQSWT